MSEKILITNEYDARKLGVPCGALIDAADAPDHLVKRWRASMEPVSEDMAAAMNERTERDLAFARAYRGACEAIMEETGSGIGVAAHKLNGIIRGAK